MFNALHPTAAGKRFKISYEFFPPKSAEMEKQLWESVKRLEALKPHFVSVTYGAGGSTRERTHAIVERIARETAMKPAAHLTCVSSSAAEIEDILREYWAAGVRHIVALRGDPPTGVGTKFEPNPEGYASSSDLVRGIRRLHDFEISVSTYPEGHPESASIEQDLDALEAKIDAGATRAITQFFFDNDIYFRFLDKARARGIKIPIVPGIMPIRNFRQVASFAAKAGASVPRWVAERFEGLDDDPETRALVAATTAVEQVMGLARAGVDEFHFYTNNRADMVFAICHLLGVRPVREKVNA
ncbi:methylenetetrahydrofolate reductase [NAD(P)H] [Methylocystis sp. IM3]|uniref:methylenetetrahydrofolate reductase [NAD(P)H] n=1 Tax=unclassified Methylocystis TaxID=2625913 RepID=UPI000F9F81A1|nr:MAG: methylenetetrahydrofolate reductase [NAD(P)H] [Hyphomicrobiales bacterium]